jgi:gluconolactonase
MTSDGDVQIYMTKSGYTGESIGEYRQPGSNGLTLDKQGRLTIASTAIVGLSASKRTV